MAAYVGGGTGSGDTHISQIMSKGKGKMAVQKKTGMAAKVGKSAAPESGAAKKTAAKKAAIAAGNPVASGSSPRAKKATMQTARMQRASAAKKSTGGGTGGY